ncbi:uncharacterized protein M437DRAFT_58081, partial [Aureobasidium melanogenum CBS 110374]
MAGSAFRRLTLATLPTEMLGRIFWLVDSADLINLRLVCKLICATANKPFAVRNFETRRHNVTEDSFKVLLAISAHETFGAYLKNIVLCPARTLRAVLESDVGENDGIVVDNSFIRSGRFSELMQQALSNIKQHSDSIAIGVHEDYYLERYCRHDCPMIPKRKLFYGEKDFYETAKFGTVLEMPEALELLFAEMRAASISINGLGVDLARHSCYDAEGETQKAIGKL